MASDAKNPSVGEAILYARINAENKEKQQRANNLVLFGIAESTSNNPEEKKKADEMEVNAVLTFLKVNQTEPVEYSAVKKIHRLKSSGTERPGAVVLEFKDLRERLAALKAAKSLNTDQRFRKVFICPDMTPAERLVHTALVKERDGKNRPLRNNEGKITGDHYFGIRNNCVVQLRRN